MAEVFIVEIGHYSDRQVVGVFTDRAKADEYVETYGGDVASFELDPSGWELPPGMHPWRVYIDLGSGDIIQSGREEAPPRAETWAVGEDSRSTASGCPESRSFGLLYCVARDEAHACKIAAEKRQAHLAEKALR